MFQVWGLRIPKSAWMLLFVEFLLILSCVGLSQSIHNQITDITSHTGFIAVAIALFTLSRKT